MTLNAQHSLPGKGRSNAASYPPITTRTITKLNSTGNSGDMRLRKSLLWKSVTEFSDRQQEVIDCLFAGMCGKEIAQELGMALRTVKGHIRGIAQQLDIDYCKYHTRVRIVYLLRLKDMIQ